MSLVLDLSGLEYQVGWEQRFKLVGDPPDSTPLDDVTFGPIEVEGTALWTGETVLVRASVGATAELRCSRCLGAYAARVKSEFEREFRPAEGLRGERQGSRRRDRVRRRSETTPATDEAAEAGAMSENDREPPVSFTGNQVDLSVPAWEALVLELPMQPVCKPTCRGLCPICGGDRNLDECGCRVDEVDSRLKALEGLLEAKERSD